MTAVEERRKWMSKYVSEFRKMMDGNWITLGEALVDPRAQDLTVLSVLRSYYGKNKRDRVLLELGLEAEDKRLVGELTEEERRLVVGVGNLRPGNGSPVAVARRVVAGGVTEGRTVKPRLSAEAEALRDVQEKLKDEAARRRGGDVVGTTRAFEGATRRAPGVRRCWEGD